MTDTLNQLSSSASSSLSFFSDHCPVLDGLGPVIVTLVSLDGLLNEVGVGETQFLDIDITSYYSLSPWTSTWLGEMSIEGPSR